MERDSALGKIGKENFSKYFGEHPVGYAGMTVRKVGRMWSSGVGSFMDSGLGQGIQIVLVLLGVAGLVLLAFRRRWWETLPGRPIVLVTAVGAASLAAPRRNEILMTLIFPLAGLALSAPPGLILKPRMVPLAGLFPAELTALRSIGLAVALILVVYAVARRRTLRNADVRHADPRRARAGGRHRHRSRQRPPLRLLLRKGQRRADPRPRRLRDLHPLHHHPAGAVGRRAQLPPALGGARGPRLGGVPPGRPARPLQGQDRDPDPRLQRGRQHRRRPRPDAGRGLRRATEVLVVDDGSATAPATSPPSTAPWSPATSPTAAAARRSAPATG